MASIKSRKLVATASSFKKVLDLQQTIKVLTEENDDLRKIVQQLSGQMVRLRGTPNERCSAN